MVLLGLLPPYSQEDVKQAYLSKVQLAHPDHGGNADDFRLLQDAYEKAQNYVGIHRDRRTSIGVMMDRYLAHEEVVEQLRQHGAEFRVESIDWMERSFGDFALLTEAIIAVQFANTSRGDELIHLLLAHRRALDSVKELSFAGCHVTNAGVMQLQLFPQLRRLDLRNTRITNRALAIAKVIPNLEVLVVRGTRTSLWARWQTQRMMRRRQRKRLRVLPGP